MDDSVFEMDALLSSVIRTTKQCMTELIRSAPDPISKLETIMGYSKLLKVLSEAVQKTTGADYGD